MTAARRHERPLTFDMNVDGLELHGRTGLPLAELYNYRLHVEHDPRAGGGYSVTDVYVRTWRLGREGMPARLDENDPLSLDAAIGRAIRAHFDTEAGQEELWAEQERQT